MISESRQKRLVCAVLASLAAILPGCSRDDQAGVGDRPQTVELSSGQTVEVQWEGDQAVAFATEQGDTIPFIDGEASTEDQLVVQTRSGRLGVFRKPNAIARERDGLRCVYLREGTLEKVFTDGFQGEPYIDPADRSLFWIAHTCTNPGCSGKTGGEGGTPKLFINRMPGVSVAANGRLTSVNRMPNNLTQPCPHCGRRDGVVPFVLPETTRRREELAEELRQVRDARDRR